MILKLVQVNIKYSNFLRKFDSKVSFNYGLKENRPFIGVVLKVDKFEYFAPLSRPKPKHLKIKNNLECLKIADGSLGVVNFNNMIFVIS